MDAALLLRRRGSVETSETLFCAKTLASETCLASEDRPRLTVLSFRSRSSVTSLGHVLQSRPWVTFFSHVPGSRGASHVGVGARLEEEEGPVHEHQALRQPRQPLPRPPSRLHPTSRSDSPPRLEHLEQGLLCRVCSSAGQPVDRPA